MVRAVGGRGGVPLSDLLPLDGLQRPARAGYAGDGEGVQPPVAARALGALPARHDGGARLAARPRRLRKVSRLQLRAGRVGPDGAALPRRLAPNPITLTDASAQL